MELTKINAKNLNKSFEQKGAIPSVKTWEIFVSPFYTLD